MNLSGKILHGTTVALGKTLKGSAILLGKTLNGSKALVDATVDATLDTGKIVVGKTALAVDASVDASVKGLDKTLQTVGKVAVDVLGRPIKVVADVDVNV